MLKITHICLVDKNGNIPIILCDRFEHNPVKDGEDAERINRLLKDFIEAGFAVEVVVTG